MKQLPRPISPWLRCLLLHRSLACVSGSLGREPLERAACGLQPWNWASGTCHLGLHFFSVGSRRQRPGALKPSAAPLVPLHRSLACVRREPWEGASGTCSLWTAALELSLWNLPPRPVLLFCGVPKANIQAPSNPPQRLWYPAPQPCLRQAGALGGGLWNVQPVTCHLGLHFFSVGSRRQCPGALKPSAAPLVPLHCRLACVRREPWEGASGTCSLWTAALELSLWNLPPRPVLLFCRVPKATSRRPQTLRSAFGTPAPQPCLCQAGALGGSLWNVQPVDCSLGTERLEPATSACTSFL